MKMLVNFSRQLKLASILSLDLTYIQSYFGYEVRSLRSWVWLKSLSVKQTHSNVSHPKEKSEGIEGYLCYFEPCTIEELFSLICLIIILSRLMILS
jgi:hypothetical protein